MAVKVISCVVCSKSEDVKYKCPTCRAAYCSVNCCKEHKLNNCFTKPVDESPGNGNVRAANRVQSSRLNYSYETEDTVPLEQLERLRGSKNLKRMLENPHLRRIVDAIDQSNDASQMIGDAMREPIFTEMADECLKIIGGLDGEESDDELT